jgi:prepilin signal peptidase PulO-like enzyme (type II secretory pathway)
MLDIFLTVIMGLFTGGLVNLLADDLPVRRNPGIPTSPDGTPRPLTAWLGSTACLLGQREPAISQPDESRARPIYDEEGKILHTPQTLSWRYPLTELLTIGLMVMAVTAARNIPAMNFPQLVLYLVYMGLFALITIIDLEHKLILFVVIIPSIILAILDAFLIPQVGPTLRDALTGAAFGFAVFFVLYLGGFAFNTVMGRLRNQTMNTTAFGYGDVMLITFSGALLGFGNVFSALFITVFLGAAGAIIYVIARRLLAGQYSMFTAIPYGPYIVAGTIIMLLYAHPVQCAIWNWSLQGPC